MIVESEKKRTTIWRVIITVTTVIIVALGVFLVVKMFTGNPLAGTWTLDDGTMTLEIGSSKAVVTSLDEEGSLTYDYKLNPQEKEIQFMKRESGTASLEALDSSFNYSVDGEVLTLSEREYGEQFIFEKE
ncbi:hypothetical protein M2150_000795 [Lachnospiraceae bacterium PM6-15]|uniref:DUF5640 domain-containing protein n=1 Tax=Ohessyouella blattaphilus TaxID=2949333 RepID=A0ABT1EID8_9FIRM|nr:hypothetical protein [Ohessyouella blattaphilus]MCP1110239.1 hypothetical protein [Ohessyouella blattaphilus]MCR8563633.1 hypothetical protein [Ohessyouella blattaphilus]